MTATDLPRLFEGDLEMGESVEYLGYHITHQSNGRFHIQMDGHAGSVGTFDIDEMDGPLDVVDEVNSHDTIREEHMYYGDDDDMIEWAGRYMTYDEEKAEEDPDRYLYIPPADELPDEPFAGGDE